MNIIAWLVIGGLAGWVASMIMKTNSRQGLLADIVVGIIGAFIGGFVLDLFGFTGGQTISGFNIMSFGTALVGAVILIALLRLVRR